MFDVDDDGRRVDRRHELYKELYKELHAQRRHSIIGLRTAALCGWSGPHAW